MVLSDKSHGPSKAQICNFIHNHSKSLKCKVIITNSGSVRKYLHHFNKSLEKKNQTVHLHVFVWNKQHKLVNYLKLLNIIYFLMNILINLRT